MNETLSRSMGRCIVGIVAIATFQLHAATRIASVTQRNLSINLGYAVNGSYRLYFSTYDGSHTWARYQSGVGWSGELRPSTINSSTYRSDYDIYNTTDGYFYGYGSVTLSMPSTDSDGDGLPDFLDHTRSGNTSFSGSSMEYFIGDTTRSYTLSGSMSRSAGSTLGSYTVYSSSGAVAIGNFAISGSSGTMTYNPDNKTVSISLSNFSFPEVITGQTSYSVPNENEVRLAGFTATNNQGASIQINAFTLYRNGTRYTGKATASDGNPETSWTDYNYYHIRVVDSNDVDNDGVPDLTDLSYPVAPSIISQPSPVSVQGGGSVQLSCSAGGTAPLFFRWHQNGTALTDTNGITGSGTSTLVISETRRSHSGQYHVVVSNSAGQTPSNTVKVSIRVPQQLSHPTLDAGGNLSLSFRDADGNPMTLSDASNFILQWSIDLKQWNNLSVSLIESDGSLKILDPIAVGSTRRFYRILEE